MIELITVYVVLGLLVAGWFAACIDAQGVKDGIKMAVGIPLMIISMLALGGYILHSFIVVFGM
jgi:hypothetical protein